MSEKIVAVDRALDILLYLYEKGEEGGISEISRELKLPKSTVHRTLTSLEEKAFVSKNEVTNNYWLGIRLYSLGRAVGDNMEIKDIMAPYLEELHSEIGEVINASILEKDGRASYKTVIIYKLADRENVISVNPKLGSSNDAHTSSVGKCLLAFNDIDDEIKDLKLKKYTENTITDNEEFYKELLKIRERGYALDNEEQALGLYCVGVPVLNKDGRAIAAISISGPTFRMKNKDLNNKIEKLKETVGKINKITAYIS